MHRELITLKMLLVRFPASKVRKITLKMKEPAIDNIFSFSILQGMNF